MNVAIPNFDGNVKDLAGPNIWLIDSTYWVMVHTLCGPAVCAFLFVVNNVTYSGYHIQEKIGGT